MPFERGAWEKITSEGVSHRKGDGKENGELITPAANVSETVSGGISFCPNCGAMILNDRACNCGYSTTSSEVSNSESDYSDKSASRNVYNSERRSTYVPKPEGSYLPDKPKSTHDSHAYDWITCPICNGEYNPTYYSICPHCGKAEYTYTSKPSYGSHNHEPLGYYDLMCANCDFIYDTRVHKSCPKCGRIPNRIPARKKENSSIIPVLIVILILLFILFILSSL